MEDTVNTSNCRNHKSYKEHLIDTTINLEVGQTGSVILTTMHDRITGEKV
jgi:hypothetical protein